MKILITGTTGRIGRAIYIRLMKNHNVKGLDRLPSSTTDYIGDIRDREWVQNLLKDVDVLVHTAALHAPHVGIVSEADFYSINVQATDFLMEAAVKSNVKHFVYTSTTALYGHASSQKGQASWIDESIEPQPRTIYHRTKIEAEQNLEKFFHKSGIPVTVLQMSRCFPEPADLMALYRTCRGVDARDVAAAHEKAIEKRLPGFNRFIISMATPFHKKNCKDLYSKAAPLLKTHVPELAEEFKIRRWSLPSKIDRVYDSSAAQEKLNWKPEYGFKSVIDMLDQESSEVLPVI